MDPPQGGAQPLSPQITDMQTEKDTTIIFGSVDEEALKAQKGEKNKKTGPSQQADKTNDNHGRTDKEEDRPKITSNTCKPIAAVRPRIELLEKVLRGWIAAKWKPKGHVNLCLGPKGFFTAIFLCLEDKYKIMDEGPYFFNSAGLYLRDWVARFNPDKEDLTWAPVWIRMYSLPEEYCEESLLKDIGNGLGEYIKAAEETKLQ
eukprot:PITA_20587